MFQKGEEYKDFIMSQLSELEGVVAIAMFGGYGLYYNSVFFGIIYKGKVYFKVNELTKRDYINAGMEQFQSHVKQTPDNFYEVPKNIINSPEVLIEWAKRAAHSWQY